MPDLFPTFAAGDILPASDWNDAFDLVEDSFGLVGPYVVTGLVPSAGAGLSVNVTAGTALIDGYVSFGAFSISGLTDATTNHLYGKQDGTGVANTTGTQPAATVKLGTAVTAAGAVTSVDTSPGSGRQTKPSSTTTYSTLSVVTKTANYTATDADDFILVDASGGAVTITLMAAASRTRPIYVKLIDGAPNTATVDGSGAELVEGATTAVLSEDGEALMLVSSGTAWWIF